MSMPKEELYRMIDALSDKKIAVAKRLLERLLARQANEEQWAKLLVNPPIDDEPWTEEDEADWQEGMRDIAEGRVKPWKQVKKELDI